MVKNLPAMQETRVQSLGKEDALEKGMATYSRILAWRIPWTEEPGELQSMGLQRVRHICATNTKYHFIWKWKWSRSVVPDSLWPHGLWLPGSSIQGIFQVRVPEWVAILFSRGSSWPRDRTQVSCIAGRCFTLWATKEAQTLAYSWHQNLYY